MLGTTVKSWVLKKPYIFVSLVVFSVSFKDPPFLRGPQNFTEPLYYQSVVLEVCAFQGV